MIIIFASHGNYAKSALQSAEMIVGKRENVYTVGLYEDMSKEDLKKDINKIIAENGNEEILILCDLYGGTPSNVSIELMLENERIYVITGLNMGMALTALSSVDLGIEDLIHKIKDEKNNYVVFPKDLIAFHCEDNDKYDL